MNTNVAKIPVMRKILDSLPAQIAGLPEVAEKFKHLFQVMHGGKSGEMFYEAEKFHFMKLIQENAEIQKCTKFSIYGCFLDAAVSGLSFDPNAKHLYLVPFNVNVGTKDNKQWEKRLSLMISGYGELALRIKQGQIKYADNPVLVYEGDEFSMGTKNGCSFVEHKSIFPRKTDNIIACYLKITRIDSSIDYKVISIEEIEKLRRFSKDPNSKAWVEGLPGMVMSKCIKHAFKSYPKTRKGDFSELSSNVVEEDIEEMRPIDYGIDEEEKQFFTEQKKETPAETIRHEPNTADDDEF